MPYYTFLASLISFISIQGQNNYTKILNLQEEKKSRNIVVCHQTEKEDSTKNVHFIWILVSKAEVNDERRTIRLPHSQWRCPPPSHIITTSNNGKHRMIMPLAPYMGRGIKNHTNLRSKIASFTDFLILTPLHKICVWTQIRKIKRKLSFNQSESRIMESRIMDLRLIFLICVQTQILCNGALVKLGNWRKKRRRKFRRYQPRPAVMLHLWCWKRWLV